MPSAVHSDRELAWKGPGSLARLAPVTSPRSLPRRLVLLVSGTLAALALALPAAHAGTYQVSTCKSPNGLTASTTDWSFSPYAASIDHWVNSCPRGGVRLTLDPDTVHPKDDTLTGWWT